jgi:hypothetical protein
MRPTGRRSGGSGDSGQREHDSQLVGAAVEALNQKDLGPFGELISEHRTWFVDSSPFATGREQVLSNLRQGVDLGWTHNTRSVVVDGEFLTTSRSMSGVMVRRRWPSLWHDTTKMARS